MAAKVTLRWP